MEEVIFDIATPWSIKIWYFNPCFTVYMVFYLRQIPFPLPATVASLEKWKVFLRILHSLLLLMIFFVLLKVGEKALDIEALFLPTSIYGFHCAFQRAISFHIQIKLLLVLKKSILYHYSCSWTPLWLMTSLYQVELGPVIRFSSGSGKKSRAHENSIMHLATEEVTTGWICGPTVT